MKLVKILVFAMALMAAYALVKGAVLYSQISRYQKYWQQQNVQAGSGGGLIYLALGDSTAQGIGASFPQRGYVGLITEKLKSDYRQNVRVVNLSKSGAKVEDVLSTQLEQLEKYETSDTIITMQIGSNDILNFDEESFTKGMEAIMARLPKHTVVGDIPYFGGGRYKSHEPDIIKANEIIYRLAKEKGVRVARVHDATKSSDSIRNYAIDYFHPSNRAYKYWAGAFLAELNKIDRQRQAA
jgi:acyl-CoA thioesterase I